MTSIYVTPEAEVYFGTPDSKQHKISVNEITPDILMHKNAWDVLQNLFVQYPSAVFGVCMEVQELPVVKGVCQASPRVVVADMASETFVSVHVPSDRGKEVDRTRGMYQLHYTLPEMHTVAKNQSATGVAWLGIVTEEHQVGLSLFGFHRRREPYTVMGVVPAFRWNLGGAGSPEVMVRWPGLHVSLLDACSFLSYVFAKNNRWLLMAFLREPSGLKGKEKQSRDISSANEEQQVREAVTQVAQFHAQNLIL